MLLETCRYKFENGKVITKMFGMGSDGWDIEPGWHHSPKDAKAATDKPKKIDGRSREARQLKAQENGDSTGSD